MDVYYLVKDKKQGAQEMNGQLNLDDLILEAAQPENDAAVSRLLKEIQSADFRG